MQVGNKCDGAIETEEHAGVRMVGGWVKEPEANDELAHDPTRHHFGAIISDLCRISNIFEIV
jgi:hypothetical protein